MQPTEQTLYEQAGGFDRILSLCRRWHALCLADPLASHPFERDLHPGHNERVAAYLAEAFGGPRLFSFGYGDESAVQRTHAGNGVHIELDEACLRRFDQAVDEEGIVGEAAVRIKSYFRRATEEMRRFEAKGAVVPNDLPLNHV